MKHSLFLSWLLYISICVTFITYHWFYSYYLPEAKIQSNIMFELQYKNTPESIKQYELLGAVDLLSENGQLLCSGQEYSFILELDVPESDSNFEIGIFGVSGDLLDIEGNTSAIFRTTV